MNNNSFFKTILNGIIFENPTFVIMLGMCPTLAITTSISNAIGMGLSTTCVLVMSNFLISLLRNVIPDKVRIPAYIIVVASLVTIIQLLIQAFFPSIYSSLGLFIPLIVVNCIILGRAESFASKNNPILSIADGIGMGLGFTIGISAISLIRELLGSGKFLFFTLIPEEFRINIFILAPGAFFVLAFISIIQKIITNKKKTNINTCNHDCLHCVKYTNN